MHQYFRGEGEFLFSLEKHISHHDVLFSPIAAVPAVEDDAPSYLLPCLFWIWESLQ